MRTAVGWIGSHPGHFVRLTASRIRLFWFPDFDGSRWRAFGVWLVTLLSAAGLLRLMGHRTPIAWFFAAVWILFPPLYYINQADLHYRTPILWLTFLAAGYLLHHAVVFVYGRVTRKPIAAPSETATIPF